MYSYANEPFDPRTVTNGGDPRLFGVNLPPNGVNTSVGVYDPSQYMPPEVLEQLQQLQLLNYLQQQSNQTPQSQSYQTAPTAPTPQIYNQEAQSTVQAQQSGLQPNMSGVEGMMQPSPGGQVAGFGRRGSEKGKVSKGEKSKTGSKGGGIGAVGGQKPELVVEGTEQLNETICLVLNELAKHEWLGVTVYNHYALTIGGLAGAVLKETFSQSRDESITHHQKAIDFLLGRGGRPIMSIDADASEYEKVPQYEREDSGSLMQMLGWAIEHEDKAARLYGHLAGLVARTDVALLNWAQEQVQIETEGGIEYRKLADLI